MNTQLNEHQKKAKRNIKYTADAFICDLENMLLDYSADEPEYQAADQLLNDHKYLVAEVYKRATTELQLPGYTQSGRAVESFLSDIRFCGSEWLLEQCDMQVGKLGY